jgi:hypothetical protein
MIEMDNTKYGKHIVSTLKTPARFTPEFNAGYARWAQRILWIDKDVVDGAFQMNCSWYLKPPDVGTVTTGTYNYIRDEKN